MAAAAAALFRSAARRSMTSMLVPRAASGALSPRQIFHGGLHRRLDLLPPAVAPARLFSSATPGSPIRNPLPCDGNKKVVPASPDSRDRELPMRELEKKIVEKQGELLRLLLQWDAARSPSLSDSSVTCVEKTGQVLHRRRESQQAKTQREEVESDPVATFVLFIVIVAIIRCIVLLILAR